MAGAINGAWSLKPRGDLWLAGQFSTVSIIEHSLTPSPNSRVHRLPKVHDASLEAALGRRPLPRRSVGVALFVSGGDSIRISLVFWPIRPFNAVAISPWSVARRSGVGTLRNCYEITLPHQNVLGYSGVDG